MKSRRVLNATILLIASTTTIGIVGQGQTKKTGHPTARRKSSKPVKTATPGVPGVAASAATTTSSGLTYIITRHGNGRQPQPGETVVVHYTGVLGSGVKFDSSLDAGKPIEFKLGAGRVIKGWDEGIGKLHVGDQATLIIPANLGYGERGAGGVIPPGATLIFVVELVEVKESSKPN
jgi:FKBP-type peptidyl-prolyl cis-trans isomerase